uniref:Uncharacterized protein n=1 Tax=Setaria italica TaxID=4555 RepID=K3YF19_SETIT
MLSAMMRNCCAQKRKMYPRKLKPLSGLWMFKMARLTHKLEVQLKPQVQREQWMNLAALLSLAMPCLEPCLNLLILIISLLTHLGVMRLPMNQAHPQRLMMEKRLRLPQQMNEEYGLESYHKPGQYCQPDSFAGEQCHLVLHHMLRNHGGAFRMQGCCTIKGAATPCAVG